MGGRLGFLVFEEEGTFVLDAPSPLLAPLERTGTGSRGMICERRDATDARVNSGVGEWESWSESESI